MADIISVTALNQYVKTLIEHDLVLDGIAIRGEVSNFKFHSSGHLYFSLKDGACSVKAVMFKSNAVKVNFALQDGICVIVRGKISLYERDGAFQIYVDNIVPDGQGALQIAFEKLKAKLNEEGLFNENNKKQIPFMPQKIGVITSKTGAALQDILNISKRRCPSSYFLLADVNVQGVGSEDAIVKAINYLDKNSKADVIIIARGGGSKEDLWVFNSEKIARAVYECKTPVVSAIGHEIDFTILDFVADMRAPTPSAAAELVTPNLFNEYQKYKMCFANIQKNIQKNVDLCYNKTQLTKSSHTLKSTKLLVTELKQSILQKSLTLQHYIDALSVTKKSYVATLATRCEALSPYSVLARGYGFVTDKNGNVITSIKNTLIGEKIDVKLQKGSLKCIVESVLEDNNERNL